MPQYSSAPKPPISVHPSPLLSKWLSEGLTLHELGKLTEAKDFYRKILIIKPDHCEALQLLGTIEIQTGNYAQAVEVLTNALEIDPKHALTQNNLGVAFESLKQFEAAIDCYNRAIVLLPDYAEAYFNRGNTLRYQEQYSAAIESYNQAILLVPSYSVAYCNKGATYYLQGELEAAVDSYDKSIAINPDYEIAHNDRGCALLDLNDFMGAIDSFDKAITLAPTYADVYFNRGKAYEIQRKFDAAIANYDRAIELNPDHSQAYCNLGFALRELGQDISAKESLLKSLSIDPNQAHAKWALTLLNIPIIAKDVFSLRDSRGEFQCSLNELDDWFDESRLNKGSEAVGCIQPFYFSYQEFNNREILSRYGDICNRLMLHWQQLNDVEIKFFEKKKKIQIGIIGSYIGNHSVWNAITKGVVSNLDPDKFDIHIFFLGKDFDQETNIAKSYAASFTQDKRSLADWANSIIEKNIEVLIYPEIGMEPLTVKLASMRLASVQIVTWGHPETSGLPTIDYFFTGQLFEQSNSQDSYREKLIELPNLGCHYSRLAVMPSKLDLTTFGIDPNQPILLCPGILFKYMPQYDWVLSEIVKRIGKSQLIFFSHEEKLTAIFKERLKKSFEERDLNIDDHVIFISWLNREDFYGLMNSADVFLDTIGFSGFNTAMQAIDCLLPIVTLEGQFMRGKFASGILMRMGMSDLIAHTVEEYIELAVRLVQNKEFHKKISLRMSNSRDILYEDKDPIRALETFLINTCRPESNTDRNIF